MEWLDVVLFGVIVMVGYGFARMGFRICVRPPADAGNEGNDAESKAARDKKAESKGAEGGVKDDLWSRPSRLAPGVFFAGFGMFIIWVAIQSYVPLAIGGDENRPSPTETESSEVMGEVLLKVMVLRPKSSTDASEPTVPKISVQVQESSLGDNSSSPSGGGWQWKDVVHQKPLPRQTLFVTNP